MKKTSWLVITLLCVVIMPFLACKNDAKMNDAFKGKYTVKVKSIDFKEMQEASAQMQEEIEKGKKELKENLEKSKKDIDDKVDIEIDGKKADLNEAIDKLGDGLGKMMEGLDKIGEGFGNLGKGISEMVIKNTTFQADFRQNGKLYIGSDNKNLNFSAKNLTWGIKDGKLIITDKDKNNDDLTFELKPKNNKEWELIGEKITLELTKSE